MQLTKFDVGQTFWMSSVLFRGALVDNGEGDYWSTKGEAEDDGQIMVDNRGPVHRPREDYSYSVRKYRVTSIDENGSLIASVTCD